MYTHHEWEEKQMTLFKFLEEVGIEGTSSIAPSNDLENLYETNKINRMDVLQFENGIKWVVYYDKQKKFIADLHLSPKE